MLIDSDDLLARIRQDYPQEYELARLRHLVELLEHENGDLLREIDRLRGTSQQPFTPGVARPYVPTYQQHAADAAGEDTHG